MSPFDDHPLALGSCLAGLGILVTGLLALLFRNPDAPRWTRPELVPMLVCVLVTALTGMGLGYIAYGLPQIVTGAGDARELLVLAGVVLALALAWRGVGIRRRLESYAAAEAASTGTYLATEPTLGMDDEPPPRPASRARAGRRAA